MKQQSLIDILDITNQSCSENIRHIPKFIEKVIFGELIKINPNKVIQNAVVLNSPIDKYCYTCVQQSNLLGTKYCINYPKYIK